MHTRDRRRENMKVEGIHSREREGELDWTCSRYIIHMYVESADVNRKRRCDLNVKNRGTR